MLKTVEKMLAVPNRLQKVYGWFCSSRLWHSCRLGCDCLFNSCRPKWLSTPDLRAAFGSQAPLCGPQQSFN